MSIKKFKKLTKKVNAIIDTMDGGDHLNIIERDLLKTYLLEMYEIVHQVSQAASTPGTTPDSRGEVTSPQIHAPANGNTKSVEATIEPARTSTDPATVRTPFPQPSRVGEQKEAAVAPSPAPPPEGAQIIDELLDTFEMNDLSDKLRMQPIKDILKEMSINETIFTVNELFDGDKASFLQTISALNTAQNFDEAKSLLTNELIHKYNWDSPSKVKKLKQFLVLVQRRFL